MSRSHNAIQAAVQRTGLSAHVIRIWEKRYGAVEPERTATNRRLYSEADIERLTLLRELTRAGQSIGVVAKLPTGELRRLAAQAGGHPAPRTAPAGGEARAELNQESPLALLERCFEAVKALDASELEATLRRAELALGGQGMLQQVAAPLAQGIGAFWRTGEITAAHEHFCSAILKAWLARAAGPFNAGATDPVIVVTTPAGQVHELGALLFAALAANLGWRVLYLGPSLPAPEIAGAFRQAGARAIALSLVYPEDDARLEGELTQLRELLPPEVPILVGGRACPAYSAACDKIGALRAGSLAEAGEQLDALRRRKAP